MHSVPTTGGGAYIDLMPIVFFVLYNLSNRVASGPGWVQTGLSPLNKFYGAARATIYWGALLGGPPCDISSTVLLFW